MEITLIILAIAGFSFSVCYGSTCPYTYATRHRTRICDQRWGICWHHKYVDRYSREIGHRCCPGYRGNDCNTPVCNPPCKNSGRCVSPNYCRCLEGTVGKACEQITCSYLKPCFPGICSFPDNCQCQDGFGGTTCLEVRESPTMLRCSAFLLMKERSSGKEMYRFTTDSSSPDNHIIDMIWVNQNDYNIMNIYFEADFSPYIHNLPNARYIERYAFGIVDGYVKLTLNKITRQGSTIAYKHPPKNYHCPGYPNTSNVKAGLVCNVTDTDFDWLLEHGDNLTVTAAAKNGGYRHILNENTHHHQSTQQFTRIISTKQMQFMFDFHPPRHCSDNSSCAANEPPLHLSNDISKMPVTLRWGGWIDDLSGVDMYSVYVYRLRPDSRTGELTEPNINISLYTKQVKPNETFPMYTPDTIGMYTILLEVADKANNTMYARRLLLYDNSSEISINDNNMDIYGSVGIEHLWISTLQNESSLGHPIQIGWADHFVNKEHVRLKLLTRVSPFKSEKYRGIRQRNVKPGLDDNEGLRRMQPVDNVHGIVRADTAFKRDKDGGTTITQTPTHGWRNVASYHNERTSINVPRQDGDSIRIWVRTFDVVNNSATDSILVHVDSSPPVIEQPAFHKNIQNASYPFSSRVLFLASDKHSGIHTFKWKLIANQSDQVFHSGSDHGNITKRKPSLQEGACTSDGECYYFYHEFEVNNCWFMVSKDDLPTQVTNIDIEVFNSAMLSSFGRFQVDDLRSLSGMEEYSGPMHLAVTGTTSYSANFQWHQGPSCYDRTDILLMYNVSGQSRTMHVHKDSEYYTLGNLDPETTYTAQFVVEYGDEKSDPVKIAFTTGEYEGLSAGAIAGITIVMLILVGLLIAGIVLWRTGKLNRYKESIYGQIQRRITRRRRSNTYNNSGEVNRHQERKSFANLAYSDVGDEDVYLYGQMVFNENQSWEVHHGEVSLVEKMASGRFADVFKASQNCKKNNRKIVVAKVLKESHTELDELVMNAKINFFATKTGSHANVIEFVGAVLDNKPLGPFMLLELCEAGVMRTWLQNRRTMMTDSVVDTLFRMTFDIAKGMDYLASKQIIHRHLAARNILLASSLEAKVAGFGPTRETEQQDGDTGKEKVPIKWMAPECMTSLKDATMQSDVWSYGIVLWEIFSLGDTPYPGIRSMDVATNVTNGYRMSRPEYCADMHYELMKKCWQDKQSSRPKFSAIVQEISSTFSSSQDDYYYYATQ
ncbi:uncharacterized protein LOC110456947 isoform X2 [Mizuhopecten yessoensis]|uniref:uncharacterized protein LOC110456947 isoform X2 n=1 Tax=Mizuhopecten yessoensis TaxID=6573 RepID=UPI000B4594C1|nr:uncharacterized protein LOC110456947 isoform X2 [Mizuhopecten yessoensis]